MRTTLSILALSGLVACGADDTATDHGSDTTAAAESLLLGAERSTFLPYQRIVLMARYQGENTPRLSPEFGEVGVTVDGPGRQAYTLQPMAQYCAGVETEPRQRSALIDVTADTTGWVFATPGEYRVTLRTRDGELVSAPLALTIAAPTSAEDVAASDRIREAANFATFQHFDGGDRYEAELTLATELAEGASAYREDMRDLLVRHYARQSVTKDGVLRAPDPDKALSYYDAAGSTAKTLSKMAALRYLRRLDAVERSEVDVVEHRSSGVRFHELQGVSIK